MEFLARILQMVSQFDQKVHSTLCINNLKSVNLKLNLIDVNFSLGGETGHKNSGTFLQKRVPRDVRFPCQRYMQRSVLVPDNVHQLRPGEDTFFKQLMLKIEALNRFNAFSFDNSMRNHLFLGDIDVVAALGDSMTAATGANAVNALEVGIDNRGLSFSIGGEN